MENLITVIPHDGSTVDLGDLFLRYTADVTTEFMFGESIQSISHPDCLQDDLMSGFREAQLGGERRFCLDRFANFIPQPEFHRAVKVHAYLDSHIDRAIKAHRSKRQSANDAAQEDKKRMLLHELLRVTGDSRILCDELSAIFFAGRDTTSALLLNFFIILARNLHV